MTWARLVATEMQQSSDIYKEISDGYWSHKQKHLPLPSNYPVLFVSHCILESMDAMIKAMG